MDDNYVWICGRFYDNSNRKMSETSYRFKAEELYNDSLLISLTSHHGALFFIETVVYPIDNVLVLSNYKPLEKKVSYISADCPNEKLDSILDYYLINNKVTNAMKKFWIRNNNLPKEREYYGAKAVARQSGYLFIKYSNLKNEYEDKVIEEVNNKNKNIVAKATEKEKNMFEGMTKAMNMEIGVINDGSIEMSPQGLAIRGEENTFCAVTKDGSIMDVTGMTFSFDGSIMLMPVSLFAISAGDVIKVNGIYAHVIEAMRNSNSIKVIDLAKREEKIVKVAKNIFGFNYVTKVVSMFGNNLMNASEDNPFGSMGQFMMMQSMLGKDSDSKDIMTTMMMMSMFGGGNSMFNFDFFNQPFNNEG